jgi:hypothetical protein
MLEHGSDLPRALEFGTDHDDAVCHDGRGSCVKEADSIDLVGASGFECSGTGIQGRAGGDHIIKEDDFLRDRFGTADPAQEVGSPVFLIEGFLAL